MTSKLNPQDFSLSTPTFRHYDAMMEVDRDFLSAGEEAYCGAKGKSSYLMWLWAVREQARPSSSLPPEEDNQNEIILLMKGPRIVACGQLRPVNTLDVLTWAGHIGYSVPPSLRGRGYAGLLLQLLLDEAFLRGLDRVLLTCDETNMPSRRVIERAGGQYENNFQENGYDKRRYWFYSSPK